MFSRRVSKGLVALALLMTFIGGEALVSQAMFQSPSRPSVISRQMPGDTLDTPSRPVRSAANP